MCGQDPNAKLLAVTEAAVNDPKVTAAAGTNVLPVVPYTFTANFLDFLDACRSGLGAWLREHKVLEGTRSITGSRSLITFNVDAEKPHEGLDRIAPELWLAQMRGVGGKVLAIDPPPKTFGIVTEGYDFVADSPLTTTAAPPAAGDPLQT